MSNHITIELCAEDRARLDNILTALQTVATEAYPILNNIFDLADSLDKKMDNVAAASQPEPMHLDFDPFPAPAPAQAPVAEPEPEPEPEPVKDEAPTVTTSDIQQKVVALSAAGKKNEVRAIVKTYADRVSGIPEDKLAEVWAKLTALEG